MANILRGTNLPANLKRPLRRTTTAPCPPTRKKPCKIHDNRRKMIKTDQCKINMIITVEGITKDIKDMTEKFSL